jgi:hypothetical protein
MSMAGTLRAGVLVALCVLAGAPSAQEREPSTILDYSVNANRDLPIRCWTGQLEREPGKTMGELFGDAWPLQPEPLEAEAHTGARLASQLTVPASVLRGLPPQDGVVVAAVLVSATGEPLKVEPLCATTKGFDVAVKRILSRARYTPAIINGQPVTSVAGVVHRFSCGQPEGCRVGTRDEVSLRDALRRGRR